MFSEVKEGCIGNKWVKELENIEEAKRKARSHSNFFERIFYKEEEKISCKTTKQEHLGRTIVEKQVAKLTGCVGCS